MWHFRPANADWAMASSFLSSTLLKGSLPFYYGNGERYPVPWSSVDKVGTIQRHFLIIIIIIIISFSFLNHNGYVNM